MTTGSSAHLGARATNPAYQRSPFAGVQRLELDEPAIVRLLDTTHLRVGNEERAVRAGELMIFDDSIEHEAWNDSDEPRVVLLFEIWRPELTAAATAPRRATG